MEIEGADDHSEERRVSTPRPLSRRVCVLGPLLVGVVVLLYIPLKTAIVYAGNDAIKLNLVSKQKYRGPVPGESNEELAVALHVSDIHLSKFTPLYEQHFRQFCEQIVPNVNPDFVVLTGDVTDGYSQRSLQGGTQQVEEWQTYQRILEETGIRSRSRFWFDMRGNHDAYGSGDIDNDETNMYEKYGVSSASNTGRSNKRAWKEDFVVGTSTYRFVFFDSNIVPGIRKPFNFYGHVDRKTSASLLDLISENSTNVTMNILAGHHPISQLWGGLNTKITDQCGFYLCGHLHVPKMRMRKSNMIELEVDDLKVSSGFRLIAIDHGVFAFSDEYLDSAFPLGLITNPKDARFLSNLESHGIGDSTHVRILAIPSANFTIASVDVYFNRDKHHHQAGRAQPVGKNIFVLQWNPRRHFGFGLHKINVMITESSGRTREIDQEFSLDGTTGSVGISRFQIEQAVGDTTMVFRVIMLSLLTTNLLTLTVHRNILMPGIFYHSEVGCSTTAKVFSWYLLLSILLVSFGPFLIGSFVGDGDRSFCFVFIYGVAVFGHGFAIDGVAPAIACFVQGAIVFPFLAFLTLHHGRVAVLEMLALPFERKNLIPELRSAGSPKERVFRYVRNFLRVYNIFLLILVPLALKSRFLGQVSPLFISPMFLMLYGNSYFVLRFSGTTWISQDGTLTNSDSEFERPLVALT